MGSPPRYELTNLAAERTSAVGATAAVAVADAKNESEASERTSDSVLRRRSKFLTTKELTESGERASERVGITRDGVAERTRTNERTERTRTAADEQTYSSVAGTLS